MILTSGFSRLLFTLPPQPSPEVLPVQVRALLQSRVPGLGLAAAPGGVQGHGSHPPPPASADREAGGEAAAAAEEREEREERGDGCLASSVHSLCVCAV